MAYDTTKLVKLSALQTLANKVNTDYAKKTELAALQTTVEGIVSTGGQANVLEGVKVNGTALTIADKIVDLLIATGTANGTLKVNGTDVAIKGLAALAYKAEISQADLDSALADVIAAKATEADLTALENLVGELPAEASSSTVVAYITEAVSAGIASIVADAPESFDTLKEIADWIGENPDSVATMNTAIQTNATNIANLTTMVGEIPEGADATTVIGYIAEAIAAIGIGDYAKTSEVTTMLEGYVATEDGKGLSANDFTEVLLTKLNGITAGATKVEASETNGNVKINGVETTVYTEPSDVVHGAIATDAEVTEMLNEVFE